MRTLKLVVYFFAVIGFLFVAGYVLMHFMPYCEMDRFRMAVSPSQQHQASLAIENCRSKNSPIVRIEISERSKPDRMHAVEIGAATSTDFDLTWLSNASLRVAYPDKFVLTQQPSEIAGIAIIFAAKR